MSISSGVIEPCPASSWASVGKGRVDERDRVPRREDDVADPASHSRRDRARPEPPLVEQLLRDHTHAWSPNSRAGLRAQLVDGATPRVEVPEAAVAGVVVDERCDRVQADLSFRPKWTWP